jgi:hypothetical protein
MSAGDRSGAPPVLPSGPREGNRAGHNFCYVSKHRIMSSCILTSMNLEM